MEMKLPCTCHGAYSLECGQGCSKREISHVVLRCGDGFSQGRGEMGGSREEWREEKLVGMHWMREESTFNK